MWCEVVVADANWQVMVNLSQQQVVTHRSGLGGGWGGGVTEPSHLWPPPWGGDHGARGGGGGLEGYLL